MVVRTSGEERREVRRRNNERARKWLLVISEGTN